MKNITFAFAVALTAAAWVRADQATITMKGTTEGSKLSGNFRLEDTSNGVRLSGTVQNAPAGDHAFHIHEFGSCEDSGKAAGSHYNPMSTPHGNVLKDGMSKAHAGDMGNLKVGADGTAKVDVELHSVSLTGKNPIAGRALILHDKMDDFSQPVGNAGGRIGCGPVILVGPSPAMK